MPETKPKKPRAVVPDEERCVSVNVSQIRQKRCPKKATVTLTHPDLAQAQRLCDSHSKEYRTAVRMAVGWVVTPDAEGQSQ